jgi:DNA polymerase
MADSDRPLTTEALLCQVRQHLESLRLAGVQWMPAPRPLDEATAVVEPGEGPEKEEGQPPTEGFFDVQPAGEPLGLDERRQALTVLAETVSRCTRCPELVATRSRTVFGVGPVAAELCFVGEAPGADEDAQGEPFVGAAGQLLNRIIVACGMKREEVYICNIIKCRPPGNRTPLPHEAGHCREYLERQIDLVRPRFICALGSTAAQHLFGTTLSIGKLRGRFHSYQGIPVLCTYHPAFLLPHRSPEKKRDVWEDMKTLMARMGRAITR